MNVNQTDVLMSRDEVVESLEHAPPWSSYTIEDPVVWSIGDDAVVLVYTGMGHRDNDHDFTGVMTSLYVRGKTGWKLAHSQQTPKP